MFSDVLITVMECIGTLSFAVSGSLIAISCALDLFGVITVGLIAATGGGIMRDLLIGNIPPMIFSRPIMILLALITSLLVFLVSYINSKKFKTLYDKIEHINLFFDALGLAAFTITGTEIACLKDFSNNTVLMISMGVITGVGGGILRDILVNKKPYVLTKHIYAVVAILGGSIYYFARTYTDYKIMGTVLSVVVTVLIRILAARFRWELPKIKFSQTEEK